MDMQKRRRFFIGIVSSVVVAILICILIVNFTPLADFYLEKYKPNLELWTSKALGQPISIEKVSAHFDSLHPTVIFSNVVIKDQAQRTSLAKMVEVRLKINLWKSIIERALKPTGFFVSGMRVASDEGSGVSKASLSFNFGGLFSTKEHNEKLVLEDVNLTCLGHPNWPTVKNIKADLVYQNNALSVLIHSASIASIHLQNIKLNISSERLELQYDTNVQVILSFAQKNAQRSKIEIVSPNIQGTITLPKEGSGEAWGIRLNRSYFISDAKQKDFPLPVLDFADLPPLSFVSNDFRYNGQKLGRIGFDITAQGKSSISVKKFFMSLPASNVEASGDWLAGSNQQTINLIGVLKTSNLGVLLKSLDAGSNLVGGSGTVNFQLTWQDKWFVPNWATLNGSIKIRFQKGNIVNLGAKTESSLDIGRFFSLVTLQGLPKYLTLDFSDLTAKGFAFDALKGDAVIKNGNISVHNISLVGPIAKVLVQGRVGIIRKDYDLEITVAPTLTSDLPLVAAVAGGPVAGVVTLAADKILGGGKSMTSSSYTVRGSWAKPLVSKSKRK
ncbi:MAG: AsmA-like C-terminal region-containing protein [Gammaproteobacteria bacterium]